MTTAYEAWEEWTRGGGSMPFFSWCDARDRLALLEARGAAEALESSELRKTLEAAPAAVEER